MIPNAVPNFIPPIDANELAGLAMEDDVESRIIETLPASWGLQHGPFDEADFARSTPWTLLVQAVDQHVHDVAKLLQLVDFIPSWRIDDVMVSYAVHGGSVGPHYDNYDVFLLQGEGERRWQLGQPCDSGSSLLPHPELRILDSFDCTDEYILGPGDILYIPPGVAHWGIARGECTTFSLGFRAPRVNDMISRWVDELLESMDTEKFYCDASRSAVSLPGEIRAEDIARAKSQLAAALEKKTKQHWFGELVTEPRYAPEISKDDIDEERKLLETPTASVILLPSAKLAWQQIDGGIKLFANGDSFQFSERVLPAIIALCKDKMLEGPILAELKCSAEGHDMLEQLLCLACISIE